MLIHIGEWATTLRECFIAAFVNEATELYEKHIATTKRYVDGYCYDGYLWDFLKKPQQVSEKYCIDFLNSIDVPFYIMWDLHSCEKILIGDYWKYPKEAVLECTFNEFLNIKNDLPEDLYIFDDDFTWSFTLTHEWINKGKKSKRVILLCVNSISSSETFSILDGMKHFPDIDGLY